jgi:DNA-binding YbaB/EbfC family protein
MFGDIGKLLKLASEMKRQMPEMQERLSQASFTAQAGDGAVTATVNGKLALVDLKLAPFTSPQCDVAMLEDMIKAAVAAAQEKAQQAAAAAMNELTGGMELPPGMGF